MVQGYSVYFDGYTGRPGLCNGATPVDGDFIALFCDERDAAQLKSELASARVVELGIVTHNPVVDDHREVRVQQLYQRALEVARAAPFASAMRPADESPAPAGVFSAAAAISKDPPKLVPAAPARRRYSSWGRGLLLPPEPSM